MNDKVTILHFIDNNGTNAYIRADAIAGMMRLPVPQPGSPCTHFGRTKVVLMHLELSGGYGNTFIMVDDSPEDFDRHVKEWQDAVM